MTPAIAVVHARGGSVRIPLKNLHKLNGRPLLAYPIDLCRACEWIGRVVVSSDDDRIINAARDLGAEVPFRRPADISEDVPSELVTEHALRFLLEREGSIPEIVVSITPATPLTRPERLDEAYRLLLSHPEWDSVTAVRAANEHPEWMVRLDGSGEARTVLGNPLDGGYNVSQNLPPVHYPCGAFWINRTDTFLRRPSLYGERWGAVVLRAEEAVDIDVPEDLARAETLARSR
jgi:CMP-N-acetylneuraminic acid synthetase